MIHHPPWCGTVVCTRGCGLTPSAARPSTRQLGGSRRRARSSLFRTFVTLPAWPHAHKHGHTLAQSATTPGQRPSKASSVTESEIASPSRESGASSSPLVSPLAFSSPTHRTDPPLPISLLCLSSWFVPESVDLTFAGGLVVVVGGDR